MAQEWLGTKQVAEQLGLTRPTVYRLINSGQLVGHRFGRVIRVRQSALADFVDRCEIAPGSLNHLDSRQSDD